jgi:hypothetical protein
MDGGVTQRETPNTDNNAGGGGVWIVVSLGDNFVAKNGEKRQKLRCVAARRPSKTGYISGNDAENSRIGA